MTFCVGNYPTPSQSQTLQPTKRFAYTPCRYSFFSGCHCSAELSLEEMEEEEDLENCPNCACERPSVPATNGGAWEPVVQACNDTPPGDCRGACEYRLYTIGNEAYWQLTANLCSQNPYTGGATGTNDTNSPQCVTIRCVFKAIPAPKSSVQEVQRYQTRCKRSNPIP